MSNCPWHNSLLFWKWSSVLIWLFFKTHVLFYYIKQKLKQTYRNASEIQKWLPGALRADFWNKNLTRWLVSKEGHCNPYSGLEDDLQKVSWKEIKRSKCYTFQKEGPKINNSRKFGVGNGNLLQYSCLQNYMDIGAWRVDTGGLQSMGLQRIRRDWAHTRKLSSAEGRMKSANWKDSQAPPCWVDKEKKHTPRYILAKFTNFQG